jgi:hypothetical protein
MHPMELLDEVYHMESRFGPVVMRTSMELSFFLDHSSIRTSQQIRQREDMVILGCV